MKIHSKKTGFYKIIIPIAVIISLLLYSIQLTYDKSFQNDKVKIREIESSTDLFNTVNMEEMITKGINQIHRDSICTMFINNQLGTPYLYYVYKDPLLLWNPMHLIPKLLKTLPRSKLRLGAGQ